MELIDLKRKVKKGFSLIYRIIKNPQFAYDDYIQFEFEKKMKINTRGYLHESKLGIPLDLEPNNYVPGGNVYLTKVLKKLNIKNQDSIIDLGCGLGSPMLYFSKFPFKIISGIEYSKVLYEGCKKNLEKINDSRFHLFNGDSGNFDSFDNYNYIFMFNPFGSSTMVRVLDKIKQSYNSKPRRITLIYKNPVLNTEIINTGIFYKLSEHKTEWVYKIFVYRTNP